MNDLTLKLTLRATDQGLTETLRDGKKESEQLGKSLDQSSDKAGHFGDQLSKTDKAAGRFYDRMGRLREANGQFVKGADRAEAATGKLNKKLKGTSKHTKKAAKETGGLSKSLAGGAVTAGKWVAGLAAGAAAATALAVAINTQTIRETSVLADTLDMSTAALTEWEYAAGQANISGEKVGDIFKDVSDKLGDFATTGGGEAADLFENLNLQLNDLINLSPDQQLLKIGEALDDVDNTGQKIFFLESLADDASRLLPLLENDAEELKRLQLEAQVLGVSLNDIDAAKVTQAAQSFDRVSGVVRGVTNDLTVELAPVLAGISNSLVDAAVEAGGFRGAIRSAVDYSISGVGFVLDYLQQLRVLLTYSQQGWLMIGQAGTEAMAGVADVTASVINTVMYPFQKSIAWIIDKYSYLVDLIGGLGGPFSDEFAAMAESLRGASVALGDFSVSADDIVAMNQAVGKSLADTTAELEAMIDAEAPSEALKKTIAQLRDESEALAKTEQKLGQQRKGSTGIVSKQADTNAELVASLKEELRLMGLGELERRDAINLRKLDANATAEQREAVSQLTADIYHMERAVKDAEAAAKPWADAWTAAAGRIDEVFADTWTGAFNGFEDFTDSLLSAFRKTLAEMAHLAITKPIVLQVTSSIGSAVGIPGISQSGSTGAQSLFSNGSSIYNNLFGNSSSYLASGATSFATSSLGASLGLSTTATGAQLASTYGLTTGVAGGGTVLTGAGSALTSAASAVPMIGALVAGFNILKSFRGAPSIEAGQEILFDRDGGVRTGRVSLDGPLAEQELQQLTASIIANLNETLSVAGSDLIVDQFQARLQSSTRDNVGGVTAGGILSSGAGFGESLSEQFNRERVWSVASPNERTLGDGTSTLLLPEFESAGRKLSVEQAMAEFQLDLQQAYIQALQAADLGGALGEYVAGIVDSESLNADEISRELGHIDTLKLYIQGINQLNETFESAPFGDLSTLAAKDVLSLSTAFGGVDKMLLSLETFYKRTSNVDPLAGIEKGLNTQFDALNLTLPRTQRELLGLVQGFDLSTQSAQSQLAAITQLLPALDSYYAEIERQEALFQDVAKSYTDTFFTEEEKYAALTQTVLARAEQLGVVLPGTRSGFRDLINSVDWTTDASQRLGATLGDIVPLIDAYYDGLEQQAAVLQTATSANLGTVASDINAHYQEQMALAQQAHAERVAALRAEQSMAKELLRSVSSMKLGDISPLSAGERLGYARSEFARLQLLADAGDKAAISGLSNAGNAYLKELSNYQPNSELYANEFANVTGYMERLGLSLGGERDISADIARLNEQLLREQQELGQMARAELNYVATMSGAVNSVADLLASLPENLAQALGGVIGQPVGDSVANGRAGIDFGTAGNANDLRSALGDFFAQGEVGTTDFAGGQLTRNADGSAVWIGADGQRATANASSSVEDIVSQSAAIRALWEKEFGYSAVNSFDVGTPYVSHDQMANIHKGEIIIDPRSSSVLRQYGIEVRATDSGESVSELRALREQVAALTQSLNQLRAERSVDSRDQIRATKQAGRALRKEVSVL